MKFKLWLALVLQWCRAQLVTAREYLYDTSPAVGFDLAADPEADIEGAYQLGPYMPGADSHSSGA